MSAQLSFLGLEPSRPTDRLFFALFPAANAAEGMSRVAQNQRGEHGLKGKPLATDRFHITLHHLGDYDGLPAGVVAQARDAAASVAMPSFDVAFDRVTSFDRPGKRPFVLRGGNGLASLGEFQQALGTAMAKAGLQKKVAANFTPHVTLLYDDRLVDEQPVETIFWSVHEFVLVHSLLGQTRHIALARWPLRG